MDIKVLGPGCAKCHKLNEATVEAVKELGGDITVEYIQDITKILEYPVLTTPALVINEKIVSIGKALRKEEVIKLIEENADNQGDSI